MASRRWESPANITRMPSCSISACRRCGYDVAKKLRAEGTGKDLNIIAVSGWGQEADKQRSRESGIDHHLVKPLEPSSLLRLLACGKIKLAAS